MTGSNSNDKDEENKKIPVEGDDSEEEINLEKRIVKLFPLFKHVAGQDKAKEELQYVLKQYQFREILRFFGDVLKPPKGVILYGEPGTGKTMLAHALANEGGLYFTVMSPSVIGSAYINRTANNIINFQNNVIQYIESYKLDGAIIFIDELENLFSKRGDGKSHKEDDKAVNALCEVMDGCYSDDRILYIAATNRLELIDDAILRSGRFDKHIKVGLPDEKGRYDIFMVYKEVNKRIDGGSNYSNNISFYRLAKLTDGFSGADIKYVMTEALRRRIEKYVIDLEDDDIVHLDKVVVREGDLLKVIDEVKSKKNNQDKFEDYRGTYMGFEADIYAKRGD